MKKTWTRLSALFLSIVMALSCLPFTAWAADDGAPAIPGYTQVTTAELSTSEKYLIVSKDIMVYVNRLRQKIEEDPGRPVYIQTVRGLGYRFVV